MLLLLALACTHPGPPDVWTTPVPVAESPAPREYPERPGDCPAAVAVRAGDAVECRGVLLPLALLDRLEDDGDRADYWRTVYEASVDAREADRAHAEAVVAHWHAEARRQRHEATATRAGAAGAAVLLVVLVVLGAM